MLLKHKVNRLMPHPGCNVGGGGGDNTTVQKADPWVGAQPYIYDIMAQSQALYNANPYGIQPYTGPSIATMPTGLSDAISTGINTAWTQAPATQAAMYNSLSGALNPQSTGYLTAGAQQIWPTMNVQPQQVNPSNFNIGAPLTSGAQQGWANIAPSGIDANNAINYALYGQGMSPFLDSMANDLVSKTQQAWGDMSTGMWENLQEQQLPGIENMFNQAGSLGASRQALLEGQAIGRTNDALAREYGDLSTNLMGQLSNLYGGVYENALGRSASLASQLAALGSGERTTQANLIQQALAANAGFGQEAGLANQSTVLQALLANQGIGMQGALANQGIDLQAQGMNLDAIMQALLANQGTDLQAQLANQSTGIDASKLDYMNMMAQMQAGQMLPGISQYPMSLSSAMLGAYAPLLQQQQALYDLGRSNYYESALAPYESLLRYAGVASPAAGYGGTSTSTQDMYSNPVSGALGGALTGYGLSQSIGALNPYMWPLILGGGLLGGMF